MEFLKEDLCEYWQDLSHCLKVKKLLKEGYLADCKFVVGPTKDETEIIHCHRIMFVLESPVFEKMLNGNFTEGQNIHEVRIEEFYPEDFTRFCFLIYCHNSQPFDDIVAEYTIENIIEIYRICHKYMVSSILNKCLNFFKDKLNDSSCLLAEIISLFAVAHELNDKILLASFEQAISNGNKLFDEELNALSPDLFYSYMVFLSTLSKKPSAAEIFTCINSYILTNNLIEKRNAKEDVTKTKGEGVQEKNSTCYIKKFLKVVDFKEMSLEEFISGPGKSEIFDFQYKYESVVRLWKNEQQTLELVSNIKVSSPTVSPHIQKTVSRTFGGTMF